MANIKSQIKRNKQNERRRVRNKAAKSEIKTRVKVAVRAAEEGAEHAPEALRVAMKRIDKAAAKGIIHKNQASNRKSRLMRRLAKVLGPEVRVNAVAPGLIDTPWTADWDTPKANTEKMAPLKRVGTVEDIAHVCVFLAQAEYTTGEVVTSDGGVQLGI